MLKELCFPLIIVMMDKCMLYKRGKENPWFFPLGESLQSFSVFIKGCLRGGQTPGRHQLDTLDGTAVTLDGSSPFLHSLQLEFSPLVVKYSLTM